MIELVALILLVLLSLFGGENGVGWPLPDGEAAEWIILREIRLPRTLMAVGTGALLSLSGTIMQAIFRNPLVEPYTLGLSGGAVLGVGIAVVGGMAWAVTPFALIGALGVMVLILLLRRMLGGDSATMLLAGVMISFGASSLNTLIMSLGSHENMSQIVGWTMGSFDSVGAGWSGMMFGLAAVCCAVAPLLSNLLNALSIGDDVARHVGVDVGRAVPVLFSAATIVAALSIAQVGIVAFVGMLVPHAARRLYGTDHRRLLRHVGVLGGAFMLLCDVAGRHVIYPRELPAGVFSGLVGSFCFIFIMRHEYRGR